jgi:hydrogenase maturation protease
VKALKKINVIGLGNILFGDEGFGVEAVKKLSERSVYPESVRFVDGGTQGLYLLDYFESCDAVLVFDALIPVEYEQKVYVYHKEELPAFIHRKMSSHQMGLSEIIGIAQLHGRMPDEMVLVGAPPQCLDLGMGLSGGMAVMMEEAVEKGREIIEQWLEG